MTSNPIKLGIVGVGKIVRDQHLPAVAKDGDYQLAAAASRHGKVDGIPNYPSIEAMLAAEAGLEAVSLCMPPQFRYDAARTALEAKKHVFLEKPPGATVSEVEHLKALADKNGVSLFASWHSRYAPAVEAARAFLASAKLISAAINWKEDVRRWHPNQEWIWEPGGFGVFDPGINALSIATHILPPMFITSAVLDFPENRAAPVAAHVAFRTSNGLPVTMELDWLQTGPQSWDILAETDKGQMVLSGGGAKLAIDGKIVHDEPEAEYPMLYRRFAEIVRAGTSDVDLAPLQHVADAFMLGKRNVVEAFFD
ncbi:Gfo/Idh/MocA family oxidoreductase [Mesorhizobium sp. M2D.F.Ca.ET.185.01.1.1]|uniref:Gfo/Idh/MocA family protein n=2 Tax=Mesorhizobium TaxID=68287 RepID=UPI000FCAB68A|nr:MULTISPECIES: Gfo/Idh/MocA family oxidoreductase [unclassified Mesorhizobium]TGP74315.1 Gfo/Idh/MocA family oxidoreductase [bacterium M00.F.Ca.ET.227.01.1.1]TGP86505.1 Gfo/Idh/MocA family oxidoreductase [bacterium M00.F.Ca.ET.221.01.1.1]TGP87606.1 Gfo/Idh/MocA family oxidoreductase [bacterium M00.F.Ca.ET.222.01.1.1]TGT73093.1 Gfo/Idh/MocA family oxidoreductase [bacterium M00.F.Ca.ET.159.01.1.1]TGT84244.1 Gfo/Idh/MocA family oxidoreductase [bacterium M00.F.Ca.ET.157.01.1.1]TGT98094.1 Gfo/Id